jgi:hypothetical protein
MNLILMSPTRPSLGVTTAALEVSPCRQGDTTALEAGRLVRTLGTDAFHIIINSRYL